MNVIDFKQSHLDPKDMERVKTAILEARFSSQELRGNRSIISRLQSTLHLYKISLILKRRPESWLCVLRSVCLTKDDLVDSLGKSGFDLIKNYEGDSDGQEYGEVWALLLKNAKSVVIKKPYTFKLSHR